MALKELEKLKNYKSETDLIKIVQEIDDIVIFKGYTSEQILFLTNEIIEIDLLCLKYETREEILHLVCDIISTYDIYNRVNWEKITNIKDNLEDDLKQYIIEYIELMQ